MKYYYCLIVGELLMDLMMQCFCHPKLAFYHISKKSFVEVKVLGTAHVLKLCLSVAKVMLPVKHFYSNKNSFLCYLHFMEIIRLSQS